MSDPQELCESCEENPADELHTCPYRSDVLDDKETMCNCCSECTDECAADI